MKRYKKISAVLIAAVILVSGCGAANNVQPEITERQETEISEELTAISCGEAAAAALDTDAQLPPVTLVSDSDMLSEVMGYDMSTAEDQCVYTQLVSAHLFELAVIRPLPGSEQQVRDMLAQRQRYLKEQAAFYPAQVEAADASVVGEKDGYYYLICDKNSAEIEEKLKSVI